MKKALIFGAALALVCGAGLMSISAAQDDKGAEFIKITDGTDGSANPAYFPHRDHQDRLKDCGICHHGKNADGGQIKYADLPDDQKPASGKFKCSSCHNKNADGIALDGSGKDKNNIPGISPIQRAGHGRCQGCHKDQKSTRGTALMACPTCHGMYKDKVK